MVGLRATEKIDFAQTCFISGIDCNKPIQVLISTKEVILRKDFVNYLSEYLHYKCDIIEPASYVVKWALKDLQNGQEVYAASLFKDFDYTTKILMAFEHKFQESDAQKINY